MKKAVQFGVVILIGIFFLYLVFKDTDWNTLLEKIKGANLYWLSLGIFISLISHWLRALRATQLYEALHHPISTKHSFYAVLIGYMMNYIIPRAGEVSRCAALSKTDDLPLEKSLGTVVTERLVDMIILLFILTVIFLLQFDTISLFIQNAFDNASSDGQNSDFSIKYILLGILGLALVLTLLLWKRIKNSSLYIRIITLIQGFGDGLLSIRHVKNPLQFILLSISIWIGYILMMYVCLFSLQSTSHLDFLDCLTVFAIGTIGIVLPAPGAGAGTYHFFVMQSLLLFGVPEEDGKAYALLVHESQMIILIVLGLVASWIVLAKQKRKNAEV